MAAECLQDKAAVVVCSRNTWIQSYEVIEQFERKLVLTSLMMNNCQSISGIKMLWRLGQNRSVQRFCCRKIALLMKAGSLREISAYINRHCGMGMLISRS